MQLTTLIIGTGDLIRYNYSAHQTVSRILPPVEDDRVLFRVEINRILILSNRTPNLALLSPVYLLGHNSRPYGDVAAGGIYEFKLFANPTKRYSADKSRKRYNIQGDGARTAWLHRKAASGGFSVLCIDSIGQYWLGSAFNSATHKDKRSLPICGVEFQGVLRVDDVELFRTTLRQGIGSQKAFGCGLLLI